MLEPLCEDRRRARDARAAAAEEVRRRPALVRVFCRVRSLSVEASAEGIAVDAAVGVVVSSVDSRICWLGFLRMPGRGSFVNFRLADEE